MPEISFTVYGDAQPAGSKRAFVNPKTGRAIVTDANRKSKPWKGEVAAAAAEVAPDELIQGPLHVIFAFYRPRPKGHHGKKGILDSAPAFPTTRPDLLKLARGVEDALTGVIWRDDSQIVTEILYKRYGEPARVEIEVVEMES